jgi:paired amphipathic helix protein Sin3a
LPPGYRIECGLENNPNSIRVTTPSGSTIHSIGAGRAAQHDAAQPAAGPGQQFLSARPGWQPPLSHSVESPEATFSVPAQNGPPGFPGPSQGAPFDSTSPVQQRSVPAAQNGTPLNHPPAPRSAHTPTPAASQTGANGGPAQQAGLEKRGPVEFNHAISYVNKIKVSTCPPFPVYVETAGFCPKPREDLPGTGRTGPGGDLVVDLTQLLTVDPESLPG